MLKNDELDLLERVLCLLNTKRVVEAGDIDGLKKLIAEQRAKKARHSRRIGEWCKNNKEKHNRWNIEGAKRRRAEKDGTALS